MKKVCESCGMPLRTKEDYPLGDESKKFCLHCSDPAGNLKTFEEVHKGMTLFFVNHQGLTREAAEETARRSLAENPLWRHLKS